MSPAPRIALALGLAAVAALSGAAQRDAEAGPANERARTVTVEVEPDAPAGRSDRAARPVTVFLNSEGGIYTPGEPNDSIANVTSAPDLPVSIGAWAGSADEREALLACVADLFSPFDVLVVDQDPGTAPHIEAVIGGYPSQFGREADVGGLSPLRTDCGVIDGSIVFAFPTVVGGDRKLCEVVAQEVAHSFGLDHELLCEDPMTYLGGCGDKEFQFRESVCGETEPRDCECSRTQNSARDLLDRLGRGERPALWLAQPSSGDVLAAGFPVQAVVTRAPDALDLHVDGAVVDSVSPAEVSGPYQLVDFDTGDRLRPGTHQVRVVAHFGGEERQVEATVEVVREEGRAVVGDGCAAGGGEAPGGAIALLVGLVLARGRATPRAGRRRPGGPSTTAAVR
ncbi:MAG TPA: hypothetical protein VK698_25360 [Kofleriaceae bacterium]|nr:hypothetical protein [Kofleriaceae bacterium]